MEAKRASHSKGLIQENVVKSMRLLCTSSTNQMLKFEVSFGSTLTQITVEPSESSRMCTLKVMQFQHQHVSFKLMWMVFTIVHCVQKTDFNIFLSKAIPLACRSTMGGIVLCSGGFSSLQKSRAISANPSTTVAISSPHSSARTFFPHC